MANTLTNLIPTIYEALDVVSRELIGFIPAVARNSSAARAAVNQSIRVPIAPATSLANNTPGVTAPDTGDQTISNVEILISSSKHAPIRWNGEETLGMKNAGTYSTVLRDQFKQAFRALANAVEADLAGLYTSAALGYGTGGTPPFGTAGTLTDIAKVRQFLDQQGAPSSDLQLVLGSSAMANLRGKQNVLFKVNEAGTDQLLREGVIGLLQGFRLHESNEVDTHTAGTASSATTNTAGYAVGSTTITLAAAGTGTILAGDIVTFNGDEHGYVVTSGDANVTDGGTITIASPGLLKAIPASATAITVTGSYAANLGFNRDAFQLVTRVPALPDGGDAAEDRTIVTDPVSGLSFEVASYRQYRQVHIEVALAWGVKCIKPEHVVILAG